MSWISTFELSARVFSMCLMYLVERHTDELHVAVHCICSAIHVHICCHTGVVLYSRLAVAGCLCVLTDDPFWWDDDALALLRGTRLGRAMDDYRPGLGRLTTWLRQLHNLHRCVSVKVVAGILRLTSGGPGAANQHCMAGVSPPRCIQGSHLQAESP